MQEKYYQNHLIGFCNLGTLINDRSSLSLCGKRNCGIKLYLRLLEATYCNISKMEKCSRPKRSIRERISVQLIVDVILWAAGNSHYDNVQRNVI